MDKPFKSIDEQIAILESRGVLTDAKTRVILQREGYYSVVNGFKDPFLQHTSADAYKPNTSFSDIYHLFSFDRNLRHVLFPYLSIAEDVLKTQCSYHFAKRHAHEREPYLDKRNYDQTPRASASVDRLIRDFEHVLGKGTRKASRHKPYLDHYIKDHDEVPIWVLLKFLTLGQAFKFFCFQPEGMRNAIAKGFSILFEETHASSRRLSQRDIRLIYDHIKGLPKHLRARRAALLRTRLALERHFRFSRS